MEITNRFSVHTYIYSKNVYNKENLLKYGISIRNVCFTYCFIYGSALTPISYGFFYGEGSHRYRTILGTALENL